jgi:two-component system response regulator DesR
MSKKIKVAILDDHLATLDGYRYRLGLEDDIEVVAALLYGDELVPALEQHQVDVLLLDITVPTSPANSNPYPVLHIIPKLLEIYRDLFILVASMHSERTLVHSVMEMGASGYILKDDQDSVRELAAVIRTVMQGTLYLSYQIREVLVDPSTVETGPSLNTRQLEILSLCATYPDDSTAEIATRIGVANSTVRNNLSESYLKLGVRSRMAAVTRARQLGLITPEPTRPSLSALRGEEQP